MNAKLEQTLRLYSGLFIAFFLVLHLVNAALGLLSLSAMDILGEILFDFWSFPVTAALLYGAFFTHAGLTLLSLYRRRSLRMPMWSYIQIALGIALPLLLVSHIVGTRGTDVVLDIHRNYTHVVPGLWKDLESILKHVALVLIAWTHMAFGIHFWLRHKPGYRHWLPVLYPACLIIPLLALLGFARAGLESEQALVQSEAFLSTQLALQQSDPNDRQFLRGLADQIVTVLGGILLVLTIVYLARRYLSVKKSSFQIIHTEQGKALTAQRGQSVLEVLRDAKVPHTAVCGGRGRCTTCRVRVGNGLEDLPPPELLESRALQRLGTEPSVRLACQLRPTQELTITPLIRPSSSARLERLQSSAAGHEQQVVCMFVDLRRSTELGEQKLPFDVIFILNQFFSQLSEALSATQGHYASFNGDGLMALYGLKCDIQTGCRDALKGAVEIEHRIANLNEWLSDELDLPLQFGIGIHCGEAIVGTMGPPETPVLNAIGDTINISARLEALTKKFSAQMVVSEAVLQNAGVNYSDLPRYSEHVKGRGGSVDIVVVTAPSLLNEQLR